MWLATLLTKMVHQIPTTVLSMESSQRQRHTEDMTTRMKGLREKTAILTMVTSSIEALWKCKTLADSVWSPCAAICNGVRPFFVFADTKAPFSSSRSTT